MRILFPLFRRLIAVFICTLLISSVAYAQEDVTFPDVPENHWAFEAVTRLNELGIILGFPDGTYQGTRQTTRYEIAVIGARLLEYVESLLGVLVDDPDADLSVALQDVAESLGEVEDMSTRVEFIERGLEEAASLEYAMSLEARIVALEQAMNELLGEERFPGVMSPDNGIPASAAEALAELEPEFADMTDPALADADPDAPEPLAPGEVRLVTDRENPGYFGISPGAISTSGLIHIGVQGGYDGLIGPVGIVGRASFNSGNEEFRFTVGGNVRVVLLTESFELYGGVGTGLAVRPGGTSILLEAPFGMEYLVTPQVGIFVQITPSYAFRPLNEVEATLTAGFNLRF